ncbi:DNA-directed DNA polymerase epsilon, subunit B, partial [Kickxella alabastrina]
MQSLIYKVFTRKYSLSLQADALLYLSGIIEQNGLSQNDAAKWLELLADTWTKREEGRPLVELAPLKELVAAVASGSDNSPAAVATGESTTGGAAVAAAASAVVSKSRSDLFTVIDAFDVPTWWYDPGKKMFVKPFENDSIMSSAEAKSALFRQRYDLLKQRVMRNENFMP